MQTLEMPLGRGCRCSLHNVSMSESHSSEYKAEDKPCREKPAHHTGACWELNFQLVGGLSEHKWPEAPQSLASSGSTFTLTTLSLMAQAKNVLHYSLPHKLVEPTKPEKTGQRDSGRNRTGKRKKEKRGRGEKGREGE